MNGRNLADVPRWLFWAVAGVVAMVLHSGYRLGALTSVGIGLVSAIVAVAAVVEWKYRRRIAPKPRDDGKE